MARHGVTYAEIAEAANHLLGQNKNPTIEQIRLHLGTGSSNTIAKHLKEWRSHQERTSLISPQEDIPPELVSVLKGLWERLLEQANAKVVGIEELYQLEISGLRQELGKHKTTLRDWQQQSNQWAQEKAQFLLEMSELETGLASVKSENTDLAAKQLLLDQQLLEKQEQVGELRRLHTQAQANLEHYRESVREQRVAELHRHEQQQLAWKEEAHALKTQAMGWQEKFLASVKQFEVLQITHTAMEKNLNQLMADRDKIQQQLTIEEKNNVELSQAREHWQQLFQQAQHTLEEITKKSIELQTEIKWLSHQLDHKNQTLTDLERQNKQLLNEKWDLTQEKAQLVGQIKQLEKIGKKG